MEVINIKTKSLLLFTGIILTVVSSLSVAQSDSSLAYYPMQIGNKWTYRCHYKIYYSNQESTYYYSVRITGDTLMSNGKNYKIVQTEYYGSSSKNYVYDRVDSATTNVYRYQDYPPCYEIMIDSLRSSLGDFFFGSRDGPTYTECIRLDTATMLGFRTTIKEFKAYIIPSTPTHILAYKLGNVQNITREENPYYPVMDNFYQDLIYAEIDGQIYGTPYSVDDKDASAPNHFQLSQNYPNPFNPQTTILYSLPNYCFVTLVVRDILGREVSTIVNEYQPPGNYKKVFTPNELPSGIYIYYLHTGSFQAQRKMILLR